MAISPQSPPPSSPPISNQLQRKVTTGILWVLGAALLFALPRDPEIVGVLFALGVQNTINIAIERAIIQSSRHDQAFLDTAWVLQIICGVACCLLECVAVGFMVVFFKQPLSYWLPMLAISAFATVVTSLNSTKIASAERKFAWGNVVGMRMLATWISKGVTFILLVFLMRYLPRSQAPLWTSLVVGAVSAVPLCALSHILLKGKPNRFQWDRTAFQSLYHYGVWILGIVALEFLIHNFEWIALGKISGSNSLGSYYYLSKINPFFVGLSLVSALRLWVLLPAYSELVRTHSSSLYSFLRKSRLIILCFVSLLALLSIILGKPLLLMLFGKAWEPIIKLLPFLAVQGIVSMTSSTYDDVLYAQGKTSTLFSLTAIQVVLEAALFLLGASRFGLQGILLGTIIASYLIYAVKAVYFSRQSLWQPAVDFPFLAIASILLISLFSQGKGLSLFSLIST
jgi:O-antigen/teichoic acid export membrane protein